MWVEGAVIPRFAVNDLETGVEEMIRPVQGSAVCSQVRDLLKIRSPGAGLPTNLQLGSIGDTALSSALTAGEGRGAMLSILDMAVSSNLPQPLAEASAPTHALLHATDQWNSQTPLSSVRKETRGAGEEPCGDDANRRQFQAALLENCSFLADLVLRQVRAGSDQSNGLLERDSCRKKCNGVRVSPGPPRSKAKVVLGPRPGEPALPPATSSVLPPTLWVEVGCRHLQTVVCEKERR